MKIGILTYETYEANLITHRLLTAFPGQVIGIMRSAVVIPGKSFWQSTSFLLTRTGLGFVVPKTIENILYKTSSILFQLFGTSCKVPTLAQMCRHFSVPIMDVKNANAADALRVLEQWCPDLLVSVYFNQKIKSDVIGIPRYGVINVHPSLLPRNRGLFPYLWALINGDKQSGVTVHWIDKQFDTGDIMLQRTLPIQPNESVASLARKSASVGAEMLVHAVQLIEEGNFIKTPQTAASATYYSWPTPVDIRRLREKGHRYGSVFRVLK